LAATEGFLGAADLAESDPGGFIPVGAGFCAPAVTLSRHPAAMASRKCCFICLVFIFLIRSGGTP
jgi:hypothetical protein